MKTLSSVPSRMYKLAYFIDGLGMGGAERLMVPVLRNLNKELFEPRVCVFQVRGGNPVAEDLRANGIPVDDLPIPYLRDLTAVPRLRAYLQKYRIDLVHTQLEMGDTLGNIATKLLRLPSVSTIHTMPSQDMSLKSKIHQQVEWFALHHFCDRIISVSEEARQHHLRISNETPAKVTTLYNGIELSPYRQLDPEHERQAVRREFEIPANARLLTTVAVLREPKGIQFMIRAMPQILALFPDTYYLIVGNGAYYDTLLGEVEENGISKHVIFAGMRRDIPSLLFASDVFVLPTLTEALPTVLAEAMAARLPIVASAVGGVPEMIENEKNGYLVTAGNVHELVETCNSLLVNVEKRRTMGENGWQVVNQKFNIVEQVRKLEKLYLDLIYSYGK